MWPYGYTLTDVPSDMTAQDHAAFVALGQQMALTNGYTPEQAATSTSARGRARDYEYGQYRMFGFTIEMSPDNIPYQDDSLIPSETGRNREAVLSLIERAWCPLGVLGASVRTARCGAFDDDLEVGRGWTSNPDGTDTAPASVRLVRGNPATTSPLRHEAARFDSVGVGRAGHRRGGRQLAQRERSRRPDDRPLAGDRPAGRGRPATDVRVRVRPRLPFDHVGPSAGIIERANGSTVEVFRVSATASTSMAPGGRHRSRWTGSPGRASASGSRPWTEGRTTSSRSRSTTCASPDRADRVSPQCHRSCID